MPSIDQLIQLLTHPGPVLRVVGQTAVDYSRERFRAQEFDGERWPARYPWQKDRSTFVNRAGVVSDLLAGRDVAGRRFEDRPAGIDTGELRDSIAYEVRGYEVVIGVSPGVRDRAQRFQDGGESAQALDDAFHKRLRRFLGTARGKPVAPKLEELLEADELLTEMIPRPFIGRADELDRRIQDAVADEAENAPASPEEVARRWLDGAKGAPDNALGGDLGNLFGIDLL